MSRKNDKAERDNVTAYTVESRPDLPVVDMTMEYPTPVIDAKLVEIRNREAREMAERIAASKRGG